MTKHHREENDCLNCGAELQGQFCHVCGQENLHIKEPFWHFIGHSISHYFHFDSRFFSTLKPLFTKPGQLTLDYIAGRRTRYLHPVSMYIFVSIIYFLIIPNLNHQKERDDDDNYSTNIVTSAPTHADSLKAVDQQLTNLPFGINTKKKVRRALDKAIQKAKAKEFEKLSFAQQTILLDSLKTAYKQSPSDTLQDRIDVFTDKHDLKEDSTYESYLKRQQRLPEDGRDNFLERFEKRRDIEIKQKTDKNWSLGKEIEHYQPKLYFILMPLLAFFIMLNFRKNHRYYVEHMVFTIHLFTAFFIFEIVAQPINHFIFSNDSLLYNLLMYGLIAWYIYTALRVFYRREPWATVRKMVTLSIMYALAFGLSYQIIYYVVYMTV